MTVECRDDGVQRSRGFLKRDTGLAAMVRGTLLRKDEDICELTEDNNASRLLTQRQSR